MKKLTVSLLLFHLHLVVQTPFSDRWEFIGKAVEEPNYHIWCTSPIIAEFTFDGQPVL